MPVTQQPNIHYPIGLLEVGDSFFLPAVAAQPQLRIIKKIAEELGITIEHRMGIDQSSGLYGMRIIRLT